MKREKLIRSVFNKYWYFHVYSKITDYHQSLEPFVKTVIQSHSIQCFRLINLASHASESATLSRGRKNIIKILFRDANVSSFNSKLKKITAQLSKQDSRLLFLAYNFNVFMRYKLFEAQKLKTLLFLTYKEIYLYYFFDHLLVVS